MHSAHLRTYCLRHHIMVGSLWHYRLLRSVGILYALATLSFSPPHSHQLSFISIPVSKPISHSRGFSFIHSQQQQCMGPVHPIQSTPSPLTFSNQLPSIPNFRRQHSYTLSPTSFIQLMYSIVYTMHPSSPLSYGLCTYPPPPP
jgi:hypothetical protein